MNPKENIFRVPIPKHNVELFISQVYVLAELCGIDKIQELFHHVEMLSRAADAHLFEKQKGPLKAKSADEKKRFIIIFKTHFRQELDYEYPNTIKPVDLHMIGSFITGKLMPKHVDSDFYLQWFFSIYLEERKYLIPPEISTSISSKAWNAFLYDNKEQIKDKREQFLEQSEGMDLINRARVAIRSTEDVDIKTKIIDLLKKYGEGSIMLADLRKDVQVFEKAVRQ